MNTSRPLVPAPVRPSWLRLPGLAVGVSVAFLSGLPPWLRVAAGWAVAPAWWIYLVTAAADGGLAGAGSVRQGAVLVLRPAARPWHEQVRLLLTGLAAMFLAAVPAVALAVSGLLLELAGLPAAGSAANAVLVTWGAVALATVAMLAVPQLRTRARRRPVPGIAATVLAAWPAGHGRARRLWQEVEPHLSSLQSPVTARPRTSALASTYRRHGFTDVSHDSDQMRWLAPPPPGTPSQAVAPMGSPPGR